MKAILSKLVLLSFAVVLFGSCKKDDKQEYFQGGTPPVLSSDVSGSTLPLVYLNAANEAITLHWTNPNYMFTTGLSSQNVTYLVDIDTTGSNFTNPNRKTISVSGDLSMVVTQGTLNDWLLNQLVLVPGVSHNVEIRVTSSMGVDPTALHSNVLKYAITPYSIPPKVTPPASGELYITGNACASDWTNSPPAGQKFTKLSATLYQITLPLIGGNSYTFLPTFGSWNDKYSIATKNDPNEIYGGDFQWQGNDILAPPSSGTYKIVVDFQRGKFTVTKQ